LLNRRSYRFFYLRTVLFISARYLGLRSPGGLPMETLDQERSAGQSASALAVSRGFCPSEGIKEAAQTRTR
jgi:hypothetical protein